MLVRKEKRCEEHFLSLYLCSFDNIKSTEWSMDVKSEFIIVNSDSSKNATLKVSFFSFVIYIIVFARICSQNLILFDISKVRGAPRLLRGMRRSTRKR